MKFTGFSEQTLGFLEAIRAMNERAFFEENKSDYLRYIMEPSKAFVVALGEQLRKMRPDIRAIPAVNKSLFRFNRDTRFSNDKSPYKDHVGIYIWEGTRKRMECPGFYFHIEPDSIMVAGGFHQIPKDQIPRFRELVANEKKGEELRRIMVKLQKDGLELGPPHYKRVPQGFDKDHPNADLLRHAGVHGMHTSDVPDEFFSADLVEYCMRYYRKINDLHRWFVENM